MSWIAASGLLGVLLMYASIFGEGGGRELLVGLGLLSPIIILVGWSILKRGEQRRNASLDRSRIAVARDRMHPRKSVDEEVSNADVSMDLEAILTSRLLQ